MMMIRILFNDECLRIVGKELEEDAGEFWSSFSGVNVVMLHDDNEGEIVRQIIAPGKSLPSLAPHSTPRGAWRHKILLLSIITFLALSEATSRFPKEVSWEQMLPKKLPTPSSAPSRGTNTVTSSHTTAETERSLPSADGKV
ncbi:hypothetical protein Tco_1109749 [Tanacetum coccineum]|uniref:Uncharacterized protein n=1 Tax=Tanacetum coccineum TaxID=301880 RepID=A0ABQ5IGX4_9ASTR